MYTGHVYVACVWRDGATVVNSGEEQKGHGKMTTEHPADAQELRVTLNTYRRLANDFTNHDTILKVITDIDSIYI